MKKFFLTLIAVVAFTFASSAQCNEQSTLLVTECGSWCVTAVVPLTGCLSCDVANGNATDWTFRRKPTATELLAVADELC